MNRIDKKFKELKARDKKAFIAFVTCGYPDIAATEKLVLEFDRSGADIVELGVPFSDPIADGPVIQEASVKALLNNVNLYDVLSLVKRLRRKTEIPLCAMTYYNPVFCFGEERFLKEAKNSGLDGLIIPDLPPEEAGSLLKLSRSYGLDVILFLSPTSSRERAKFIVKKARGFIYYVSLTGVTGSRKSLPADMSKNIKEIKKTTDIPVCVGFGVSAPEHVRQVYKVADGAIVGSAIIQQIKANAGKRDLVKKVGSFVKRLANV
ncbi:MAG: tryptophan synthase subunit alpha [Candidatus Omnitrophota bacterium]|nr:tryptophan synthase subunit alpha [Candidatus Omnitrophota bacterium]MDD5655119.1 tryptophan synthase subunit alpha [Candidatus Omnitrophota bacterium]